MTIQNFLVDNKLIQVLHMIDKNQVLSTVKENIPLIKKVIKK